MASRDNEGMPIEDSKSGYEIRMRIRSAEAAVCQRRHIWLGYARLTLVVGGIVLAWFAFHRHEISRWWVLAVCAVFVLVARRHAAVLERRAQTERAIRFLELGTARMEDRFAELPVREVRVDASASLFAGDLDLFGRGSLFNLLCTARTSMGEDALASWLLEPAQSEQAVKRQGAIAELSKMFDLREELASCGDRDGAVIDLPALTAWACGTETVVPQWLRWIAPVLVAMTLAAAAWYFSMDRGWPLAAAIVVDATITYSLLRRMERLFLTTERASHSLRLIGALIGPFELQRFEAPLLKELQSALGVDGESASHALRRLALLAQMMEQRASYVIRILNAPLLYSVQLAGAAQAWRRRYGTALERWLRALGELEALTSLATYSYEHPADVFPELVDGASCFEAAELGHPLIAAAKCVRNDVSLGEEARLLLVSGSNMSGKSTLLRAVGVNAVLAMAGSPVRAVSLRMTPLQVGASIQVSDSLEDGRSRFYSEILRLRAICAMAEEKPVLFLLDELLDGTNSSDRLMGAAGMAKALVASGAIGLISTHDLALTKISEEEHVMRNVHFEDRIEDGEIRFDFKLRDGLVTTSNGVALMRMVGLKV
jgi:hypothetical protein